MTMLKMKPKRKHGYLIPIKTYLKICYHFLKLRTYVTHKAKEKSYWSMLKRG